MSTIETAAREYARRPKDEIFPSLDALIANAEHQRDMSQERTRQLAQLRAVPTPAGGLHLATSAGEASMTHYAFGQLARWIGAPADYLRSLPPAIASDAINFGIDRRKVDQDGKPVSVQVLIQQPNGIPTPTIRALTSSVYQRVWDAQLYADIRDRIVLAGSNDGGSWQLPPTWDGQPAGAYRGDRDSFLIVVNGGSIVTDPSLRSSGDGGKMYRALMIRNSEVGAASLLIERVLYRFICGNHMLWGAVIDRTFKRRHVGEKTLSDTLYELRKLARDWANAPASRDEQIIQGLIDREIAPTKDQTIEQLRKFGASKDTAEAAYGMAVQHESQLNPRSYWGAIQGLTRVSQQSEYQDDRLILDQLAMQVAARGRALLTV